MLPAVVGSGIDHYVIDEPSLLGGTVGQNLFTRSCNFSQRRCLPAELFIELKMRVGQSMYQKMFLIAPGQSIDFHIQPAGLELDRELKPK
jgi:hypothetical protein